MRSTTLIISVLLVLLVAFCLGACGDYPRDPRETSRRVHNGILDVGVSENPPWIVKQGNEPTGVEAEIIKEIAGHFQAEIAWHWGTTDELLSQLETHELQIVAAGLNKKTPWGKHVALSSPYYTTDFYRHKMVLALPRGENGFLLTVDSILSSKKKRIAASVPSEELP